MAFVCARLVREVLYKKTWKGIDAACSVYHGEKKWLGEALSLEYINPWLRKIKDICAHFHRSDKVNIPFSLCLLFKTIMILITHVVVSRDLNNFASLD